MNAFFVFLMDRKPSATLNIACAAVGLLVLCGVASLFVSGHWVLGIVAALFVFAFVNAGESFQSEERARRKANGCRPSV